MQYLFWDQKDNPDFIKHKTKKYFIKNKITAQNDHIPINCRKGLLKKDKRFHLNTFHGAELLSIQGTEWEFLCFNDRIAIPKSLQEKLLE